MRKDIVAAYLARDGDPDARAVVQRLVAADVGALDAAVVIPARDESPWMVQRWAAAVQGRRVLVIVVVNGDAEDSQRVTRSNAVLLAALRGLGTARTVGPGVAYVRWDGGDVLVVDRASAGRALAPRQGVGRARRIGCDLALALWHHGVVRRTFIDTTDADATLPADYFDDAPSDAVAIVRPFVHVPDGDPALDHATALYEMTLRYYVAGLGQAGSPWAMHTVGSCLSVDAYAYAAVRGLPARPAGEDFYLLAKVAKLGRVVRGAGAPIRICSRRSTRVPFGTGPGSAAIAQTVAQGEVPRVYAPASFAALRHVLAAIDAWARQPGLDLHGLFRGSADDPALADALCELGFADGLARAARSAGTPAQRGRRAHEWLDAFRTLKLVHHLRARGHTPMPWPQAVETLAGTWPDTVADALTALAGLEARAETAGLGRA